MKDIEPVLFKLISVGLRASNDCCFPKDVDWDGIYKIATEQGVASICLDGLQYLHQSIILPHSIKIKWIVSALQQEHLYNAQWKAANDLAKLWHDAGLHIYVMKGLALANLYPRASVRYSCDMDCFLTRENEWDGEKGNRIVESLGIEVDRSYYKNSKFCFNGLTVENHHYLLPVKGSKKTKRFERWLRGQMMTTKDKYIGDSYLQAPSDMFNAVYILAHAQEHFLEEGIVLKHICDWAMVLKAYAHVVDWSEWKRVCSIYGLLTFGYAMSRLANKICGVIVPFDCPKDEEAERRLLDDTLYREVGDNALRSNLRVRIHLTKKMFCNSWKYRLFSDTNSLMFCVRRVGGFLFEKGLS